MAKGKFSDSQRKSSPLSSGTLGYLFPQELEDQVCPSSRMLCSGNHPNGIMILYPFPSLKEHLTFASPIDHPYQNRTHQY